MGVIAGAGGLVRLPQRIPYQHAMEMALTGERIDAERAERLGLVNRTVETRGALSCAVAVAERIARNAPLAVRASNEDISAAGREEWLWKLQREQLEETLASEDAYEGITAFNAKRSPVWRGR